MSAAFALTLLRLDGVGRVAAHRLLEAFPSLAALRATPREQVLVRLKGVPSADALVKRLFDAPDADAAADEVANALHILASRHIRVWSPRDDRWPPGLRALDRAERPVVLYTYGVTALLDRPLVAFLGRPPLSDAAFDAAQALVRAIGEAGGVAVAGAATGFDVVLHKCSYEAGRPSVAVVPSGMAQMARSFRPTATAAVHAGGLVLSPFDMHHGPFAHDDRERALVQAALATVVVAVAPPDDSSEARAVAWARAAGRPVVHVDAEGRTAEGLDPTAAVLAHLS